MAYDYQTQKPFLFTDKGQRMLLRIRDRVNKLLDQAGAVRMQEALLGAGSGDSWDMLACVDRMVELGEIREITGPDCIGQYRVFVARQS